MSTQVGAHNTWVLVAGTGLRWGVPQDVSLAAAAVGDAVARFDCGLVTGGAPRAGRTRLLWVALASSPWHDTGLQAVQAALDPHLPLDEMKPADLQVALVELRQQIDAFAAPAAQA